MLIYSSSETVMQSALLFFVNLQYSRVPNTKLLHQSESTENTRQV